MGSGPGAETNSNLEGTPARRETNLRLADSIWMRIDLILGAAQTPGSAGRATR